jgi:hypothetical protein
MTTTTTTQPAEDDFESHFAQFAAERIPDETPADAKAQAELDSPAHPNDEDAGKPATTAAAPSPAPAAPAAAPAPAPTEPARPKLEDLLQFVPADKADTFKAIVTAATADLQRMRSDEGRVAAYQQRYGEAKSLAEAEKKRADQLAADLAALQEKAKTATTAADRADVQEELDDLAKEFPELSTSVNLRIKQELAKLTPPAPAASQSEHKPTPNADDADTTALADQYAALVAAHPDYQQAVKTPAYAAWRERQPPTIRKLMASDDAQDAIYVLNLFKQDLAQATQRAADEQKAQGKQRLAENVGIKGTPARVTSTPDDFESAFGHYAAKRFAPT